MMMNKTRTFGVEKFDVVVMNPPYQELRIGNKKSNPLWDKFVIKVIEQSLVENGYLVAVHPDGWRNIGTGYEIVKQILKKRQMLYLQVHDKYDGLTIFGAKTTFDFYCIRNNVNNNFHTKIKCKDGKTQRIDISKWDFIPNGMYDEFNKILGKKDDEKVHLLYSRSSYGSDKKHISKVKTSEFKFPVIYTISKDASLKFLYSNTNKNGHYGLSKLIWSNGISEPYIDCDGDYSISNFAYAIIDEKDKLPLIKKALLNKKFLQLMQFSDGSMIGHHRFNHKAISLFRKDFWVDFLDYDETAVAEETKN